MVVHPDFREFSRLCGPSAVVPVWTEILADLETPVSAFMKMRRGTRSFLLESAEQEERTGRYSFIGTEPSLVFQSRGGLCEFLDASTGETRVTRRDEPLSALEEFCCGFRQPRLPGLPGFCGGFVGYVSYDYVRHLERLPARAADDLNLPDLWFMLAGDIVIFDHFRRRMLLVANSIPPRRSARSAYRGCVERLEAMRKRLSERLFVVERRRLASTGPFRSTMSRRAFEAAVRRTKEYIAAGDIIQAVISHRWQKKLDTDPLDLYRALRSVNPSPYMFFLDAGEATLVGSSPEILARVEGRRATVRPIAGTRRRGTDAAEDGALERELVADEKERAEHIMLVDLGRNDLGRVCVPGTVRVTDLMRVERYSHVMHLVSNVEGRLPPRTSAFSVLRATFPAGTLSGAPNEAGHALAQVLLPDTDPLHKVSIIPRGPYGGAVGYFGFGGDMDLCIAIRTFFAAAGRVYLQAGAGIVADSSPAREYDETVNKARALMEAYRLSREI